MRGIFVLLFFVIKMNAQSILEIDTVHHHITSENVELSLKELKQLYANYPQSLQLAKSAQRMQAGSYFMYSAGALGLLLPVFPLISQTIKYDADKIMVVSELVLGTAVLAFAFKLTKIKNKKIEESARLYNELKEADHQNETSLNLQIKPNELGIIFNF